MADSSRPLHERECVPCHDGTVALVGDELQDYVQRLGGCWKAVESHHIEKEFRFRDFREALAFVNQVGGLAENAGHHPEILLSWGKVRVRLWTHKLDGLAEADFVLAAQIDRLLRAGE
jgi:4a-hydroxytetrahydrobiopterin dehydratase